MTQTVVSVDTSRVERMLEDLDDASRHMVLYRAAQNALGTISGIPTDTGRLARSPRIEVSERHHDQSLARIVTDVYYGKFVFHGHATRDGGWVPGRPPRVGYTASDFARDIAYELGLL